MQMEGRCDPEQVISAAIDAVDQCGPESAYAIESLPGAVYFTNAEGAVTHFNRACVDFAGREPNILGDQWCVTWKLYREDGTFLPHHECPMAVAIREQRRVRGARAIAERPDGSRVTFVPYPTPMFDAGGRLVGAVNLLADTSDLGFRDHFIAQAEKCRRLAKTVDDEQTGRNLLALAAEYDDHVRAGARIAQMEL